jgi:hypothetical protein
VTSRDDRMVICSFLPHIWTWVMTRDGETARILRHSQKRGHVMVLEGASSGGTWADGGSSSSETRD